MGYVALFISVLLSVGLIHYLIHLHFRFQDETQPTKDQIIDGFIFWGFSIMWTLTIYLLNHNL